jgi:hypothetical protein
MGPARDSAPAFFVSECGLVLSEISVRIVALAAQFRIGAGVMNILRCIE